LRQDRLRGATSESASEHGDNVEIFHDTLPTDPFGGPIRVGPAAADRQRLIPLCGPPVNGCDLLLREIVRVGHNQLIYIKKREPPDLLGGGRQVRARDRLELM
jgi:hypothetical protein